MDKELLKMYQNAEIEQIKAIKALDAKIDGLVSLRDRKITGLAEIRQKIESGKTKPSEEEKKCA